MGSVGCFKAYSRNGYASHFIFRQHFSFIDYIIFFANVIWAAISVRDAQVLCVSGGLRCSFVFVLAVPLNSS